MGRRHRRGSYYRDQEIGKRKEARRAKAKGQTQTVGAILLEDYYEDGVERWVLTAATSDLELPDALFVAGSTSNDVLTTLCSRFKPNEDLVGRVIVNTDDEDEATFHVLSIPVLYDDELPPHEPTAGSCPACALILAASKQYPLLAIHVDEAENLKEKSCFSDEAFVFGDYHARSKYRVLKHDPKKAAAVRKGAATKADNERKKARLDQSISQVRDGAKLAWRDVRNVLDNVKPPGLPWVYTVGALTHRYDGYSEHVDVDEVITIAWLARKLLGKATYRDGCRFQDFILLAAEFFKEYPQDDTFERHKPWFKKEISAVRRIRALKAKKEAEEAASEAETEARAAEADRDEVARDEAMSEEEFEDLLGGVRERAAMVEA